MKSRLSRAIWALSFAVSPFALASVAQAEEGPATEGVPLVALSTAAQPASTAARTSGAPTAAEAERFVADAERQLLEYSNRAQRIAWVYETYITPDTEAMTAAAGADGTELAVRLALEAARYATVPGLPAHLPSVADTTARSSARCSRLMPADFTTLTSRMQPRSSMV